MFGIGLFEYQRRRYRQWERLSPAGKAWWGVKKALQTAVVSVVLAGVIVYYFHPVAVQAVVDGTAGPLTLVGPVVRSLPVIAVATVIAAIGSVVPTRREDEFY